MRRVVFVSGAFPYKKKRKPTLKYRFYRRCWNKADGLEIWIFVSEIFLIALFLLGIIPQRSTSFSEVWPYTCPAWGVKAPMSVFHWEKVFRSVQEKVWKWTQDYLLNWVICEEQISTCCPLQPEGWACWLCATKFEIPSSWLGECHYFFFLFWDRSSAVWLFLLIGVFSSLLVCLHLWKLLPLVV